jgi:hypothetical protein
MANIFFFTTGIMSNLLQQSTIRRTAIISDPLIKLVIQLISARPPQIMEHLWTPAYLVGTTITTYRFSRYNVTGLVAGFNCNL